MKLNVDFSALDQALNAMGAKPQTINFDVLDHQFEPIDIKLKDGFEIDWDKDIVVTDNGLISVDGRQALLYIQDHGCWIQSAINDPSKRKKFHVAYCFTLERMRNAGRYERYFATNKTAGNFYITGTNNTTRSPADAWVKLQVCKYCLLKLDYKGFKSDKNYEAFKSFSLEEFFETYQTHFKHMPSRKAGDKHDNNYSDNWTNVSSDYRASVNWQCEKCGVDLSSNRGLLDTHHKNGVKSDESIANLVALCKICHSQEPMHGHMKVPYKKTRLIREKRREQGINAYVT